MSLKPSEETTRELVSLRNKLQACDAVATYALWSSEAEQVAALKAIREDLLRFLGGVR